MVESVRQNLNVGSGAVHDQKKSRITISDAQGSVAPAKQAIDQVSVDVALSMADKVKSMSSEPPINIQLVNEIKQKVSEGRYPIDLNTISSRMFESIKDG